MQRFSRKSPVIPFAVGIGRLWLMFAFAFDGGLDGFPGHPLSPRWRESGLSPNRISSGANVNEVTLNHLFEVMLKNMPQETNMQNADAPFTLTRGSSFDESYGWGRGRPPRSSRSPVGLATRCLLVVKS